MSPAASRASFAQILPDLIAQHGDKLLALALQFCRNRADAEDLVQDAFLQAQRKWHNFRGESDPGTWIYSIASNLCRRRHRDSSRRRRLMPPASSMAPWRESEVAAAALKTVDAPLTRAEQRESEAALREAITRMPAEFRIPLVMKEMLELPVEIVAQALNLKPETVRTRVHRARLLLRKAMTSSLASRPAPAPIYERQVCADLLHAKLDAMDMGRHFPIGQDILCRRCQAVFRELDLVQDACAQLGRDHLDARARQAILKALAAERVEQPAGRRASTRDAPAGKQRAT